MHSCHLQIPYKKYILLTGIPSSCGSTGCLKGRDSGSCRYSASNVGIRAWRSSSGLNTETQNTKSQILYVLLQFYLSALKIWKEVQQWHTLLAWLRRWSGWRGSAVAGGLILFFSFCFNLWLLFLNFHSFCFYLRTLRWGFLYWQGRRLLLNRLHKKERSALGGK